MFGEPQRLSVQEALRHHVSLQADVSDALTALPRRQDKSLSVALSEARDLAAQLEPGEEGGLPSQTKLESWLGAVLRGPHDEGWFDGRVRSDLRGWSELTPAAHILVIGCLRRRLTDLAVSTSPNLIDGKERISDALARLFEFELALVHLDARIADETAGRSSGADPLSALPGEASRDIRNALSVIETSVYLVRHYSQRGPGYANLGRHLDRILKHLHRTKLEIVRLVSGAAPPPRDTAS